MTIETDQVSEYQAQGRAKVAEEQAAFMTLGDDPLLEWCAAGENGAAKLFRHIQRGRLVKDHASELWYQFPEGSHYWLTCDRDEQLAMASDLTEPLIELGQRWYQRKMDALKFGNDKEVKKAEWVERLVEKQVSNLRRRRYLQDVLIQAAAGADSLGIRGNEWDSNPDLFPFTNGILELPTGNFRPGRPEDFIKNVAPVAWKGFETPCPKWEQFWKDIMAGDSEKIGYNKRLLGSALPGRVIEHKLPIWWGPGGRSGKGTALETLGFCMGPLAGPIQAEILLAQKYPRSPGAPSPEIMAFKGKRLVWASETDEGRKLNAGKVKWLCGGDTLVGRGPYDRREITFAPSHTLLLITNFRPVVNPADAALWDRLHLVEFPISFVDDPKGDNQRLRNPHLAAELKEEAMGIMSWLVAGYYEWLEKGLAPPSSVLSSTKEYRRSEDSIEQFLEECCVIGEGKIARAGELREAYIDFCKEDGFKPIGEKKFAQTMRQRFYKDRDKIGKYYKGLGLIDNG